MEYTMEQVSFDAFNEGFEQLFNEYEQLVEAHKSKQQSQPKQVKIPSEFKPISQMGVTAVNEFWSIYFSPKFKKAFETLPDTAQKITVKRLNKFIPTVTIPGRWPVDCERLEGHRYKIFELKIAEDLTSQPIRILYFTYGRNMLFGNIFIKREDKLSKTERESADSSYELFYDKLEERK